MKYSFFAACGVVTLASTMTLSAQTPATPTTRPQTPAPTQPAARTDQNTVTVTGCLKGWDSTMGTAPADAMAKPGDPMAKPGDPMAKSGTTPTAGTRYMLTATDASKPATPSATTTPSTTPGAQAHPQPSQYIVTAGSGVNLAAHVNHQVRVTGTVAAGHAMTDKPAAPATRPGDPKASTGMTGDKAWGTLTATSVTMVSATCSATE